MAVLRSMARRSMRASGKQMTAMRPAPGFEFQRAKTVAMAGLTVGLPQLLNNPRGRGMFRDVEMQNASSVVTDDEEAIRKPVRCQPTTVSGATTIKEFFHSDQTRWTVTQNNLSSRFSLGLGCRRLKTASC